jgi:hypothetical protein
MNMIYVNSYYSSTCIVLFILYLYDFYRIVNHSMSLCTVYIMNVQFTLKSLNIYSCLQNVFQKCYHHETSTVTKCFLLVCNLHGACFYLIHVHAKNSTRYGKVWTGSLRNTQYWRLVPLIYQLLYATICRLFWPTTCRSRPLAHHAFIGL